MEMMKNSITNFPDPWGLKHYRNWTCTGKSGLNGARKPIKKPDEPSGDRALAHPPNPEPPVRVTQRVAAAGVAPQPGRFIWQLVGVLET